MRVRMWVRTRTQCREQVHKQDKINMPSANPNTNLANVTIFRGGSRGGVLGFRSPPPPPPPPFWGPPNFIKRGKNVARVSENAMICYLTVTRTPPPPFRNPVSAPDIPLRYFARVTPQHEEVTQILGFMFGTQEFFDTNLLVLLTRNAHIRG